jgi:hypothetical protein
MDDSWFRTLTIYDVSDGEVLVSVSIPESADNLMPPLFLLQEEWEARGIAQYRWSEKHINEPLLPRSDEVLFQMGMDVARGMRTENSFSPDTDLRVEWRIEKDADS